MKLKFTLNHRACEVEAGAHERLLDILRDRLGLTGTKEGCGIGECGACTVIVDGNAVNACLTLGAEVEGKHVLTIEGIAEDGELSPIQQAMLKHHAFQCGFCTPGMVMSAKALLDKNPHPSREEIKTAIAGNLCRCTGYEQIISAIEDAARSMEPDGEETSDICQTGGTYENS